MPYEVNANVSALRVYNNLGAHQAKASNSLAMISSGLKAAGGVDVASQGAAAAAKGNFDAANTSISLVQNQINRLAVVDQGLNEVIALAQKGLEVFNRRSDANADTSAVDAQLAVIVAGINEILDNTEYAGVVAFGTASVNAGVSTLTMGKAIISDAGLSTPIASTDFTQVIDNAVDQRAETAAYSQIGKATLQILNSTAMNELAAVGQAQDTDIAKEMMNLTSANIMTEAATAMLAQAMQLPNSVLRLLQ